MFASPIILVVSESCRSEFLALPAQDAVAGEEMMDALDCFINNLKKTNLINCLKPVVPVLTHFIACNRVVTIVYR